MTNSMQAYTLTSSQQPQSTCTGLSFFGGTEWLQPWTPLFSIYRVVSPATSISV